jgi:NAD(P)-dependent dehydrogenase (short-subunit alcohol dehydrogenase family)
MADLDRLYAVVEEQKGSIDILFANAGVSEFAMLGTITEAHLTKSLVLMLEGFCSPCKKHFLCFVMVAQLF